MQTNKIGTELRILVVRADRLGDVVLSTPVVEVIKKHYPNADLTFMVRSSVVPVLKGLESIDRFFIFDPDGVHNGIKGFHRLYRSIRDAKYRFAIVLQSNWKIAFAIFLARVRYRVGPLSKIYSFVFYNRGVRQRRSQVEMHEADYNLQLLRRLGIRVGSRRVSTRVHVSEEVKKEAVVWLIQRGFVWNKPLILIHPGMGGSALNWPETHYVELIQAMLQLDRQVLVTGGPTEADLLERIKQALGPSQERVIFYSGTEGQTIEFYGGLCCHADVVVAPSTGPLHVAVALGRPVVTFYPPIRVQSALRWGPYLPDESKASVFVPEIYCGQDFKCLGNMCNYFPCMKGLVVRKAVEEINRHLTSSSLENFSER